MPAKSSTTESGGFTAEERATMKARAAEGKRGAKKADGLQEVLDKMVELASADRALAERAHMAVTATKKAIRAPILATETARPVRQVKGRRGDGSRAEQRHV